ncbi:branched-chain amino acid ABC transporter permease [Piscinibacter sakaiensis]|uniref:branched-chain amino acid ABC transporter permease n=1 Tax=Piscinibacter sakaiensis TaxID=1547922 RepID=UPI003AAC655B
MLTLQVVLSGILLGGLYACMAIGFSVIWGVTGLINLAHGSMILTGAYLTWWLHVHTGIDPFLTLPAAAALLFVLGALLQRFLIERVIHRSMFMTLVLTFGVNMVVINILLQLFSADIRAVTMPYASAALQIGPIRLPWTRIAVFVLALGLTGLLYLFMSRSRLGNAIHAVAQNPRGAATLGIDVRRVRMLAFGIGAALAGASGSLMAALYAFSPIAGDSFTLKSFVIVLLGGLGSMTGAIVAAIVLGVAENLVSGLGAPGLRDAVSFFLLLAILLLRPRGLFGTRTGGDARVR